MLFLISLMSTKWKLLEMHVRFIIMTCIANIITEEPLYCMHMCSTLGPAYKVPYWISLYPAWIVSHIHNVVISLCSLNKR